MTNESSLFVSVVFIVKWEFVMETPTVSQQGQEFISQQEGEEEEEEGWDRLRQRRQNFPALHSWLLICQ